MQVCKNCGQTVNGAFCKDCGTAKQSRAQQYLESKQQPQKSVGQNVADVGNGVKAIGKAIIIGPILIVAFICCLTIIGIPIGILLLLVAAILAKFL